jgi:hypothetical protein
VLVLLTPHPEGGEHFDLNTGNHVSLWTTGTRQPTTPSMTATTATPKLTPTAGRSRGGGGRKAAGRCADAQRRRGAEAQRHVERWRLLRRNALRRPTLRYSLASLPMHEFPTPTKTPPPHTLTLDATHPVRGRGRAPPPPVFALALALAPPLRRCIQASSYGSM